ncbi:hypothetical protein [Zavarzinella formosa]|uniref:hypothetical protein n=1 Tax=Zavarzinella formosa TaxID=360055 RepID=UPI0003765E00|nr:hypothetical protein [Zavarzinella formosa]
MDRINIGRSFLTQLVRDGFNVRVAFWAKTKEEGSWFLYIGTDVPDPGRIGEAYRRVYDSLTRFAVTLGFKPDIGLSDIKLVNSSNPIAQMAVTIRDRAAGRVPIVYLNLSIAGLAVEEAYFYPPSDRMKPDEVLLTVANLMNHRDAGTASQVKLADGSSLTAIPVGLNVQSSGEVRVTLIDFSTQNKREVSLADITSIG